MHLVKCPRCELNYMKEGDKYCEVCRREIKGEDENDDSLEMCTECNEHPVIKGEDLCIFCLREKKRQENMDKKGDEENVVSDADIDEMPEVSELDEIDIAVNDIPPPELDEIDRELGIDEEENSEDENEEEYDNKKKYDEEEDEFDYGYDYEKDS